MSMYDGKVMDSDLDAFKNSSVVQTASIVFNGVLGAGARMTRTSAPLPVTSPDFAQILFDNSYYHAGKYKSMQLELQTLVHESTFGSEIVCVLSLIVSGNQVYLQGDLISPYGSSVNLDTCTITFRYIPYEATL